MIMHGDKQIQKIYHGDKEIIRAYQGDSLVFRSRLIEGEDYEVYTWLQAHHGLIHVMNGYNNLKHDYEIWVKEFKTRTTKTNYWNLESHILSAPYNNNNSHCRIYLSQVKADANTNIGYPKINPGSSSVTWGDYRLDSTTNKWKEQHVWVSKTQNAKYTIKGYLNGSATLTTKNVSRLVDKTDVATPLYIFGAIYNNTNYDKYTIDGIGMKIFEVTENGNVVMNLKPCKLIKNISGHLDFDGRERKAGESGMIDQNGIFHGNIATITPNRERYFEATNIIPDTAPK